MTGDVTLDDLYDFADNTLRDRLTVISGVADVQLIGEDRALGSGWLVVDAFDFMVHLQTEEMRDFYRLDQLWKDAPELSL